MVGNKKNMAQIAHDLIDFIGEESAEQFVEWLSGVLPSYETKGSATGAQEQDAALPSSSSTPAAQEDKNEPETAATTPSPDAAPATKRVVSLKGISSTQPTEKKMVALSSSRGTVRT